MADDCIFCKIIKGDIPAKIVFRDDRVVAFEEIKPQAPIHILIVPVKHIPTLLDLTEDDQGLMGYIYTVINHIAKEKSIDESGFRLIVNCKKDAGQEVFHIHIHLIGGRKFGWTPG